MGLPPESRTRGKRLTSDLDPVGRPIHGPVLPGAEPEHDDAEAPGARAAKDLVEVAEIELAFLTLDFVPVDRILDGVRVHGLELGPGALHAVREGAVVVHLAAQNDERLPVHHEGEPAALLHQLRNGLGLREGQRNGGCQDQSQTDDPGQRKTSCSCHWSEYSMLTRGKPNVKSRAQNADIC